MILYKNFFNQKDEDPHEKFQMLRRKRVRLRG